MRLFYLVCLRGLRQAVGNPHLTLLPLAYLALSLFLLSFLAPDNSGPILQGPFWVLVVLSTIGTLSQSVARDQQLGLLTAFQNDCPTKMLSYVVAKVLALFVAWSGIFGASFLLICLLQESLNIIYTGLVCAICLSLALSSLYVLLDSLLLQGRSWPVMSVVLFVPFILPALLFITYLCSNPGEIKPLFALLAYSASLSSTAIAISYKCLVPEGKMTQA